MGSIWQREGLTFRLSDHGPESQMLSHGGCLLSERLLQPGSSPLQASLPGSRLSSSQETLGSKGLREERTSKWLQLKALPD